MQVDPIKPTLKAPGTKRLKLKYDKVLSSFAFKFNLRRYILVLYINEAKDGLCGDSTRCAFRNLTVDGLEIPGRG